MKESLIDTDILSYYMRGIPDVIDKAKDYLNEFLRFNISSLTVFEILKGLRKKDLSEKEKIFKIEIQKHNIYDIDFAVMDKAASLIVELEAKGRPIAYGDLFIASTALHNNMVLVTNNTSHFEKIEGIVLENWMKR